MDADLATWGKVVILETLGRRSGRPPATIRVQPEPDARDDDKARGERGSGRQEQEAEAEEEEEEEEEQRERRRAKRGKPKGGAHVRASTEVSAYTDTDAVHVLSPTVAGAVMDDVAGWSIGGSYLVDAVSDLAVPVGANKSLAVDRIKAYTSNASMTALRGIGNIPNTTSLLGNSVNERAAKRSWFVPTAKNWVNVENGNILRNMLSQIMTGRLTVKQAAQSASDNITSVLNG